MLLVLLLVLLLVFLLLLLLLLLILLLLLLLLLLPLLTLFHQTNHPQDVLVPWHVRTRAQYAVRCHVSHAPSTARPCTVQTDTCHR